MIIIKNEKYRVQAEYDSNHSETTNQFGNVREAERVISARMGEAVVLYGDDYTHHHDFWRDGIYSCVIPDFGGCLAELEYKHTKTDGLPSALQCPRWWRYPGSSGLGQKTAYDLCNRSWVEITALSLDGQNILGITCGVAPDDAIKNLYQMLSDKAADKIISQFDHWKDGDYECIMIPDMRPKIENEEEQNGEND